MWFWTRPPTAARISNSVWSGCHRRCSSPKERSCWIRARRIHGSTDALARPVSDFALRICLGFRISRFGFAVGQPGPAERHVSPHYRTLEMAGPYLEKGYAKSGRPGNGQNWAELGRIGQIRADSGRFGQVWAESGSLVRVGTGRFNVVLGDRPNQVCCFLRILAQASRRVAVRLKTSRPGAVSGSTQKYPRRSNW